jgi:hypothetical protein
MAWRRRDLPRGGSSSDCEDCVPTDVPLIEIARSVSSHRHRSLVRMGCRDRDFEGLAEHESSRCGSDRTCTFEQHLYPL